MFAQVLAAIGEQPVDLVISDMAPISVEYVRPTDQPHSVLLGELALDLAALVLRPDGDFLSKIFLGEGFDACRRLVRGVFDKVQMRKPSTSRDGAREQFLLARHLCGA